MKFIQCDSFWHNASTTKVRKKSTLLAKKASNASATSNMFQECTAILWELNANALLPTLCKMIWANYTPANIINPYVNWLWTWEFSFITIVGLEALRTQVLWVCGCWRLLCLLQLFTWSLSWPQTVIICWQGCMLYPLSMLCWFLVRVLTYTLKETSTCGLWPTRERVMPKLWGWQSARWSRLQLLPWVAAVHWEAHTHVWGCIAKIGSRGLRADAAHGIKKPWFLQAAWHVVSCVASALCDQDVEQHRAKSVLRTVFCTPHFGTNAWQSSLQANQECSSCQ